MNRRILIQVAAPAVVIGLLLFGTCLVSAWYINRLQADLAGILSQNVSSLRPAQQLEIDLRQLRFHCFLYLIDPRDDLLTQIDRDQDRFQQCLADARRLSTTPEEQGYVEVIEQGYAKYLEE